MAVLCATPTLGGIITNLAAMVGIPSSKLDVLAINAIAVRGFLAANVHSASDTIRALQRAYFFDFPEIDGKLVAVLRGGVVKATILRTDMVVGEAAEFETAREQGVEFPQTLHLAYSSAESDYIPTKATSIRRSIDVRAYSEIQFQVPVNFEPDDAAQVADRMIKLAWTDMQGTADLTAHERFAYLTASDIILVEVSPGTLKRVRIQKISSVDATMKFTCVLDRAADYVSVATAAPTVAPYQPPGNLPGATTFELMDLPALVQTDDTLHIYIAAHGEVDRPWTSAIVEMLIDTQWVYMTQVEYPSSIGQLEEALASHVSGLDVTNTVLVSLSDDDIASITQTEFDIGGNMALVGDEIINFRDVVAEGANYRLSHLNRQVLNTPTAAHSIGARFVMLANSTTIPISSSFLGTTLTFRAYTTGNVASALDEATILFEGNSQQEWTPLHATKELINADWQFTWHHNKRIGAPNVAVASQFFDGFEFHLIKGAVEIIIRTTNETLTYTEAEQIADFGVAVTSFDSILIYADNVYTGLNATAAVPVDISGSRLLLSDGSGSLLLSGGGGVLNLGT